MTLAPTLLLPLLMLGACAARICAEEHRVAPGDSWSHLGAVVAPGDEIILEPGTHLPASFMALRGTAAEPITIRGHDPDHPACIQADGSGLLLQSPAHVVLQDLVIEGASHNGLNIDDQDGSRVVGAPWEAHLTLRRVTVRRTGPQGNRDGIKLSGLSHVRVEQCLVEGWGGSAIDMVGCHEVEIDACTIRGLPGHAQASGVQAKGGSTRITITGCRFEDAGMRAVNVGGSTGLAYFRPPVPQDAPPGSWYEAESVRVERCVFTGADCAVAIVGARDAQIRDCTIVRPRRWPFRLLQETTDPRFGPSRGPAVAGCIIVADSLRTPVNIGPGTDPSAFRFGDNLWWAPDLRAHPPELPGQLDGEQVVADPALDEACRPRSPDALRFGAHR